MSWDDHIRPGLLYGILRTPLPYTDILPMNLRDSLQQRCMVTLPGEPLTPVLVGWIPRISEEDFTIQLADYLANPTPGHRVVLKTPCLGPLPNANSFNPYGCRCSYAQCNACTPSAPSICAVSMHRYGPALASTLLAPLLMPDAEVHRRDVIPHLADYLRIASTASSDDAWFTLTTKLILVPYMLLNFIEIDPADYTGPPDWRLTYSPMVHGQCRCGMPMRTWPTAWTFAQARFAIHMLGMIMHLLYALYYHREMGTYMGSLRATTSAPMRSSQVSMHGLQLAFSMMQHMQLKLCMVDDTIRLRFVPTSTYAGDVLPEPPTDAAGHALYFGETASTLKRCNAFTAELFNKHREAHVLRLGDLRSAEAEEYYWDDEMRRTCWQLQEGLSAILTQHIHAEYSTGFYQSVVSLIQRVTSTIVTRCFPQEDAA